MAPTAGELMMSNLMKRFSLSVAVVAVLLSAGRAGAVIDNTALACGTEATYYPRGDRWSTTPQTGAPPIDTTPIAYLLQADGSVDVPGEAEKEAIGRAASTWTQHQCSAGVYPNVALARGVDYVPRDLGDNDATNTWRNIILWLEGGAKGDWPGDSQTIALTTNIYSLSTGSVLTSDMAFNGVDFHFRAKGNDGKMYGCSPTGAAGTTCYDVEVVAVHEFGHFLGYNHVQCTDAVMYPRAEPTSSGPTVLSIHEQTGLCAVYPPRDQVTSKRDFGELCALDADCKVGLICIRSPGNANVPGYCTLACTSTDGTGGLGGCPVAYVCAALPDNSRQFCRPGVHNTGSALPQAAKQNTAPADLCAPCAGGQDCSNGLCVKGTSASLCTVNCNADPASTEAACPLGMHCLASNEGASVCWPDSPGSCLNDKRAGLNEDCFNGGDPAVTDDDQFTPCGPGLICFVFAARCGNPQMGSCVPYCNGSDSKCGESTQTCCYGLDASGNCQKSPPSTTAVHGGCFHLRREGQSCLEGQNSICQSGTACFAFGDLGMSRCYRNCPGGLCGASQECVTFPLNGCAEKSASLCCANGTGTAANSTCQPDTSVQTLDVGVKCTDNAECDSAICQKVNGASACSRFCSLATTYGCPDEQADVNLDGVADGGFNCMQIGTEGMCWPKRGPIAQPKGYHALTATTPGTGGGCCRAAGGPLSASDLALGLLLGSPLALIWRQRRQGRRRG